MKKNIKKIIAIGLISSSICMLPLTGASAEARWRNNGRGWWYMQDNGQPSMGWIQTNGKWYYIGDNGYMKTGWLNDGKNWYYLNSDGSMATNSNIDGYQIDNNGVWIQNTTNNTNNTVNTNSNNTTNINNGVINNTNVTNNVYVGGSNQTIASPTGIGATPNSNISPSSNNTNTSNTSKVSTIYNKTTNPYTNETIAKKQNFDGTNGFKQIADNVYVYYENGIMLNNCWKEFDDGIRYFNENGYMVCNRNLDYIHLASDGTTQLTTDQQLDKEENKRWYSGTVATNLVEDFNKNNYSLEYIKYMCDLFNIPIKTQYEDVYNKNEDGKILNVYKKYGKTMYERSECESITIYIGKYTSRLNLN